MAAQTEAVNRLRQGILAQRVVTAPTGKLPGRWLLHAGPGWGKTSFGAQFPKPIFLQSRGETGLQTLIEYGQLPPTPFLPEAMSWSEARSYVRALRQEEHDYVTLVIDTINGLEILAKEHVQRDQFDGSERDFDAYGKGAKIVTSEWNQFLADLDALRAERRMVILLLCHSKIKTFNNPTGSNYDRYTPEMTDAIFGPTYKWVDGALFGALETQVIGRAAKRRNGPNPDEKVKVSADVQERILYTEETAAWSAKNRHGLPPELECGESAAAAYRAFTEAVKSGKQRMQAALAFAPPSSTPQNSGEPPVSPTGSAPEPPATAGLGSAGTVPSAPSFAAIQEPPEVVKAIWGRMKDEQGIIDEFQSLRAALFELLGKDKADAEWLRITQTYGGGNPTHKNVCRRVAYELWKAIQDHQAAIDGAQEPGQAEMFQREAAYAHD